MSLKVTISGSYRKHLDRILEAKREFEEMGVEVVRPATEEVLESDGAVVRLAGDPAARAAIVEAQLQAIKASDLLYVVNPGGYVGPSATAEVGYAHRDGTPVVCSEAPFEEVVADLTEGTGDTHHALALIQTRQ